MKCQIEGAPTDAMAKKLVRIADTLFNAPPRLITIDETRVVFHFKRNTGNMIDSSSMQTMLEWLQTQGLVSADVQSMWVGIDQQGKFFCWCVRGQ